MEKIIKEDGKILFVQVIKELTDDDILEEIRKLEEEKSNLVFAKNAFLDKIADTDKQICEIELKIKEYQDYIDWISNKENLIKTQENFDKPISASEIDAMVDSNSVKESTVSDYQVEQIEENKADIEINKNIQDEEVKEEIKEEVKIEEKAELEEVKQEVTQDVIQETKQEERPIISSPRPNLPFRRRNRW